MHRGLWKLGLVESLIKDKDGHVRRAVVKSTTLKKGNNARLRRPLQRLYPLELGARSKGYSTADIPDVPTGTEHAEVWPRLGTASIACIVDIPDMLDGAEDAEKRPRREAARRADKERKALMENKLL